MINTKEKIDDDVIGFYALLLEVDRRINPHLYKEHGDDKIMDREMEL